MHLYSTRSINWFQISRPRVSSGRLRVACFCTALYLHFYYTNCLYVIYGTCTLIHNIHYSQGYKMWINESTCHDNCTNKSLLCTKEVCVVYVVLLVPSFWLFIAIPPFYASKMAIYHPGNVGICLWCSADIFLSYM